jgi:hypothetical protein
MFAPCPGHDARLEAQTGQPGWHTRAATQPALPPASNSSKPSTAAACECGGTCNNGPGRPWMTVSDGTVAGPCDRNHRRTQLCDCDYLASRRPPRRLPPRPGDTLWALLPYARVPRLAAAPRSVAPFGLSVADGHCLSVDTPRGATHLGTAAMQAWASSLRRPSNSTPPERRPLTSRRGAAGERPECRDSQIGQSAGLGSGGATTVADSACVESCWFVYAIEVALCGRIPTPPLWASCVAAASGWLAGCLAMCAASYVFRGRRPNPKTSLCFLAVCPLQRFEDDTSDIFEPGKICFRKCYYGCGNGLEEVVTVPPFRTWPTCVPGRCPPTLIRCMHYDMANRGAAGMGCPPDVPAWMPPGGGPGRSYRPRCVSR